MAQSNLVSDDNEDTHNNSNMINFGTSLLIYSDEDRAAAMQDFALCATQQEGDYISDEDKKNGPNPVIYSRCQRSKKSDHLMLMMHWFLPVIVLLVVWCPPSNAFSASNTALTQQIATVQAELIVSVGRIPGEDKEEKGM